MSPRERVRATVRGLPVDQVPVFLWINAHAGCRMMAEYRPSSHWHWNLAARASWLPFRRGGPRHWFWRGLPLIFDIHTFNWANAYGADLGSDMIFASYGTPWRYAAPKRRDGRFWLTDIYGVRRALGQGIYPDMARPAIERIEDAKTYRLRDPRPDGLYDIFRAYRRDLPHHSIAAEVWGPQDFTSTSLFGMERYMLFLADYPDEMKAFLQRWTDYHIEVARRSAAAGADVVMIFDDSGYDNRPFISMRMWREFTYPQLKRLVDAIHEAGALAGLHSCGFQMPFLPHYVEAGVDLLQAFQPKAGNDFARAYGEFGDRLTFVTGIDVQRGERLSPAEYKAEIIAAYRLAGRRGRHILGTTHEVQHTMPDANLDAMLGAIDEIREGRHDD